MAFLYRDVRSGVVLTNGGFVTGLLHVHTVHVIIMCCDYYYYYY